MLTTTDRRICWLFPGAKLWYYMCANMWICCFLSCLSSLLPTPSLLLLLFLCFCAVLTAGSTSLSSFWRWKLLCNLVSTSANLYWVQIIQTQFMAICIIVFFSLYLQIHLCHSWSCIIYHQILNKAFYIFDPSSCCEIKEMLLQIRCDWF